VDGKKHGLHTEWDGNGKVTSQTKWENGEEVEKVK
jgi:antitoxin component YwqK of YwqJK toxin-antitoxin module